MKATSRSPTNVVYKRVGAVFGGLAALYALTLVLVLTPFIQTHVLYAHYIDFLWYNKFDHPEHYGLAPGKTVNLKLQSADNTTLGAWFIFADPFYRTLPYPPPSNIDFTFPNQKHVPDALQAAPTIPLPATETPGTRARPPPDGCSTPLFTSRLGANVLAGVGEDARAAWDWLVERGAREENILILGHSLGTAITGLLAAQLGREGVHPRGTVLMSPFSSIRSLVDQYYLFGFLPILKPLSVIPLAPRTSSVTQLHPARYVVD
ncbi:hypothetical protein NLJ89_g11770 [Agrocybe chaxingu]|uniref:Uncharacterized protein n=1 Tax=Agrocybe chaxingu TaxID=84603 RepID=A0A9W8MQV7_9AGAR|nr:hypothetical protein NLJ89_g11770 [Agrocybe chaxingu]